MNKSKQQPSKIPRPITNNKPKNSVSKTVSVPVAKARIEKFLAPKYSMPKQSTDGRVCIRHREYIGDIAGSVNFSSNAYAINPGLPLTFPWLNTIAVGYESYRFKHLSFIYESSKSTATNGSVLMAVDFDPQDAAPTSKTQALAYQNAIRGPVWESFSYVCSQANLAKMNQKFIRYGALITGQDALLYDVGNLYLCPSGQADTSIIGELHVDYEVEFLTPQLDFTAYALTTAARYTAAGTISSTNWLGTSITSAGGVSASYSAPGLTILIPGQYILMYTLIGTGLAQSANPVFSSTGNLVNLVASTVSSTQITVVLCLQIDVIAALSVSGLTTAATTFTQAGARLGYYAYSLG